MDFETIRGVILVIMFLNFFIAAAYDVLIFRKSRKSEFLNQFVQVVNYTGIIFVSLCVINNFALGQFKDHFIFAIIASIGRAFIQHLVCIYFLELAVTQKLIDIIRITKNWIYLCVIYGFCIISSILQCLPNVYEELSLLMICGTRVLEPVIVYFFTFLIYYLFFNPNIKKEEEQMEKGTLKPGQIKYKFIEHRSSMSNRKNTLLMFAILAKSGTLAFSCVYYFNFGFKDLEKNLNLFAGFEALLIVIVLLKKENKIIVKDIDEKNHPEISMDLYFDSIQKIWSAQQELSESKRDIVVS